MNKPPASYVLSQDAGGFLFLQALYPTAACMASADVTTVAPASKKQQKAIFNDIRNATGIEPEGSLKNVL